MQVRSHQSAERRLSTIVEYYAATPGGKNYALKLLDAFSHVLERLADHPELGPRFHLRPTPLLPRQFRRLPMAGSSIVYLIRVERAELLVVDYWHQARDPGTLVKALDGLRA